MNSRPKYDAIQISPLLERTALAGLGLLVVAYSLLVGSANFDFAKHYDFLHGDEQRVVSFTRAILQSRTLAELIHTSVVGLDRQYGQILYNLSAFAATIFGQHNDFQGSVIVIRMVQALLLIAAYLVLVFSLLRSHLSRLACVALLLSIPSSVYYLTFPKPEPVQFLSLSLFLAFYFRAPYRFGWYWMFAGLSFGAKISVAPILVVAVIASALTYDPSERSSQLVKQGAKGAAFFFLGWVLAVPYIGLALVRPHYWSDYLDGTFRNLSSKLDLPDGSVGRWFADLSGVFEGRTILLLCCLAIVAVGAVLYRKRNREVAILMAMGLFQIAVIIYQVERSPFVYLLVGGMLLLVGLFRWAETLPPKAYAGWLLLTLYGCYGLVPRTVSELRKAAHRSTSPQHLHLLELRELMPKYLAEVSALNGRSLNVHWDQFLYPLEPSSQFSVATSYEGYLELGNRFDFIFIADWNCFFGYAAKSTSIAHTAFFKFLEQEKKSGMVKHYSEALGLLIYSRPSLKLPSSFPIPLAKWEEGFVFKLSNPGSFPETAHLVFGR